MASNKSYLRSQVDGPSTNLDGAKYAGNKSTRARIFGNASDSDDDNEESFMTARSALGGEQEMGDEEADEMDDEEAGYEPAQPFGAVGSDSDEDSATSGKNLDKEEDAEIDEEEEDGEEDGEQVDEDADEDDSDADDADDSNLHQSIKTSQNLDRQRGQAVVAQLQAYDKLLEMRIGMQKAVTQVNSICGDEERDFSAGNEDEIASTLQALNELSEGLFSVRDKFIGYDSSVSVPSRKRPRVEESSAVEYVQGAVQDSFAMASSYEPHLIDTLKTTSNKVSLASTKGFSAVNKDAWAQVEDVLRELPKLRSRVGVRRGASATTGQYEAEVFDDGDFYQTLLKEIIESKSGEGKGEEAVKPNKKKVKRDVDTRATKGRKLKYNVHDKLQNFMVPIPPPKDAWGESQISELFSSLMGSTDTAATPGNGAAIGNLKLF